MNTFRITFEDGRTIEIEAFNASQASILAAADRIRNGDVVTGNEHKVEKIRLAKVSWDNVKSHPSTTGGRTLISG
jgi:hypothetical protein